MAEESPGERARKLRSEVETKLRERGAVRIRLLEELADTEREIRLLLPDAAEVGFTTREIGSWVGLVSSAVSKWLIKARQEK